MRLHPVDEGVQPGDLLEVSLLDLAPQSVALRLLPLPHLALEHHTAEEGGRLSAVTAALLGTGVARVEGLDAGRPRGGSVQPVRGGGPSVQLALQLRGAVVGLSGGRGGSSLGGLGGQSVRLRGEELGGVADGEGELLGVAVEGRGSLTGSGGFEALLVGERNIKWVDSLLCLSHLRFEKQQQYSNKIPIQRSHLGTPPCTPPPLLLQQGRPPECAGYLRRMQISQLRFNSSGYLLETQMGKCSSSPSQANFIGQLQVVNPKKSVQALGRQHTLGLSWQISPCAARHCLSHWGRQPLHLDLSLLSQGFSGPCWCSIRVRAGSRRAQASSTFSIVGFELIQI